MCRAVSARSEQNGYMGDVSRTFVAKGNLLMTVSSLFYFIGSVLQLHVVLEQPHSSCLPLCMPIKGVLEFSKAMTFKTYLGSFGAQSVKPLSLYSTWSGIAELECAKPVCESSLVTRDYNGGFTGRREELLKSQEYTPAFGRRVAQLLVMELSN